MRTLQVPEIKVKYESSSLFCSEFNMV